ncbi:hypothetical protein N0V91_003769 [Didymella pomorum]|uniref:Uncharacterized protein n=1 Tax=Didymella pomorum TaxID=749634 RepID=A0A9W8ZK17_9PLEO|nr:hypothetical protein N0V91_003769 [Didymella pomorum]
MATNGARSCENGTNGTDQVSKSLETYSVPEETQKVFDDGILNNPLVASTLPHGIAEAAAKVRFEGTSKPSIPINWRFAESISALKGLEASMINVLLSRKYGLPAQEAVINTDHAQLFFMSVLLNTIDPDGDNISSFTQDRTGYNKYFKDTDLHAMTSTIYRAQATNIYRCANGRYFHLHGSMNPAPTQDSLGLPHDMDVSTQEEAWKPYSDAVGAINSDEMQRLASEEFKQAGTICWSSKEFLASDHGKANNHVGLYEIHALPNTAQPPCWWPETPHTSPKRPLAGLKVVDLTRVIAAPALTRGLAELGASVMRVTAAHVTDMSSLHVDLSWGKWNSHLDFRNEEDRKKLRDLLKDADVVVQGYRPGVLDKYGFSPEGIVDLVKDRESGIIVVRENCYGWYGPWAHRSGWQQISDACCGVSMAFGRAMGHDEPVTPVFPNSDFCTGVSGVVGVLNALLRRGEEGGSWRVDWLVNSVGVYPRDVWQDVWQRNGQQVFRHYHNMGYTLPRFMQMLKANAGNVVLRPDFFETRYSGAIGKDVLCPKPVIQYPGGKVELKYNVGTRGNGVDQARWPEDLMTEIVA